VVAAGATLALDRPVSALLRRLAVIDYPGSRSSHQVPTLRGGGLGPAVAGAVILALALETPRSRGLLMAIMGLAALGFVEDVRGVPAVRRLVLQMVIGAVTVPFMLSGVGIDGRLYPAVVALAVLALVSYVNAFNFMDGINGISVTQAVVAGLNFVVVGAATDTKEVAVGGAVCAGTALGFAPSNVPRARMFLGDVGSYYFGSLVGGLAILGLASGSPPEVVLAPLTLYVADTGLTLLRRVRAREAWLSPHRDHVYQRLTDLGLSHMQVSAGIGGLMALCALLGMASLSGSLVARIVADLGVLAVIAVYETSPHLLAGKVSSPPAASDG